MKTNLETDLAAALHIGPGWQADNLDRQSIETELGRPPVWTFRHPALKASFIDATRTARAVNILKRLPRENEVVHVVAGESFAVADLLPALLEMSGRRCIDALDLATLGFSAKNLALWAGLIEAKALRSLRVLGSDYFRRASGDLWTQGRETADRAGFELKSYRSHVKLALLPIGRTRLTLLTSANARSCSNLEFFFLTAHPATHRFYHRWFDTIFAKAAL
jgi:hypothetical protein